MLTDLPKTLLVSLVSISISVTTILIMVFAYRCIPYWKIALGLTGAAMAIIGLAAAIVILYWFLIVKSKNVSRNNISD